MYKGSIKFWWDKTLVTAIKNVDVEDVGNIFTPNIDGKLKDKFGKVNKFNLI